MLTIFSLPKAFTGIYKIIQENAVASWAALEPKPNIILFGNDAGTKSIAQKYNSTHIPDIECSEIGTPYVSYLFKKAASIAKTDYICFINSDIILDPNLLDVIKVAQTKSDKSLLISKRWETNLNTEINFLDNNWFSKVVKITKQTGAIGPFSAIDLFIFPKDLFANMPQLSIGHPGAKYDNWMIYHAKANNHKVFDLTESITIIHQNHPIRLFNDFSSEKAKEHMTNLKQVGGYGYCFDIYDADFVITKDRKIIKVNFSTAQFLKKIKRLLQRLVDPIRLKLPWIDLPIK
jgi:hypothetical protein